MANRVESGFVGKVARKRGCEGAFRMKALEMGGIMELDLDLGYHEKIFGGGEKVEGVGTETFGLVFDLI